MNIFLLIIGFAALLISGDLLVRGGVTIARYFKISPLVVGLTVISFGTSAPELIVSVQAALSGHPDIALGNVIGSNISNISLVLAFTCILLTLPVNKRIIKFNWAFMFGSSLLALSFILDGDLLFWEGIFFVIILLWFIYHSINTSRKDADPTPNKPQYHYSIAILFILLASVGLYFGARWLVLGATNIARSFHISESVISVTVIAFGTSVPELATSVIAALKKETDISVGNIIGSNIFNVLAILGITSIIHPIKNISQDIIYFHAPVMLAISLLLFVLMVHKRKLNAWKGFVLLACYVAYMVTCFI